MNKVNEYLDLAEHNVKLLDLITYKNINYLSQVDFSDWMVTITFYIICIYVKSAAILFGELIEDHHQLRQFINTNKEFLNMAKDNRKLEEANRDSRYEGKKFSKEELLSRFLPRFNRIRDNLNNILRDKGISNIPKIDIEPFFMR